jgi:hypothetical protein
MAQEVILEPRRDPEPDLGILHVVREHHSRPPRDGLGNGSIAAFAEFVAVVFS